jgi:protein NRD1
VLSKSRCSEFELRQTFSRFGQVQTCIVNKDKRHAFVKMYFRKDAEAAKAAMEENRGQELRTRWGVGFGPRDCSDYQSGISIIPIHKLTEADRKWMLTAPFGGSGGRPIVEGLSVEEPDIEIGAGVSSKAISRRMQTDKGGNHGPKSSRENNDPVNGIPVAERGGSGRWRHGREKRNSGASDHRRDDRNGKGGPSDEPVVLGLPAGITLGPNGINYPPNFAFQS